MLLSLSGAACSLGCPLRRWWRCSNLHGQMKAWLPCLIKEYACLVATWPRVAAVLQGAWCDCLHWLHAESGAMQIFYGLAAPPTSYGGYGGNAKEAAKCAPAVSGGKV